MPTQLLEDEKPFKKRKEKKKPNVFLRGTISYRHSPLTSKCCTAIIFKVHHLLANMSVFGHTHSGAKRWPLISAWPSFSRALRKSAWLWRNSQGSNFLMLMTRWKRGVAVTRNRHKYSATRQLKDQPTGVVAWGGVGEGGKLMDGVHTHTKWILVVADVDRLCKMICYKEGVKQKITL